DVQEVIELVGAQLGHAGPGGGRPRAFLELVPELAARQLDGGAVPLTRHDPAFHAAPCRPTALCSPAPHMCSPRRSPASPMLRTARRHGNGRFLYKTRAGIAEDTGPTARRPRDAPVLTHPLGGRYGRLGFRLVIRLTKGEAPRSSPAIG